MSVIPNGIMSCSMEDVKKCTETAENLIKYAKDDFQKQLVSLDNYNPIVYHTSSYADTGLDALLPPNSTPRLSFQIKNAIDDMNREWVNRMQLRTQVSSTLSQWGQYLTAQQDTKLRDSQEALLRDARLMDNTISYCEDNLGDSCLEMYQQSKAKLLNFDRSLLQVLVPTNKTTEDNLLCHAARILGHREGRISDSQFLSWTRLNRAPLYFEKGRRDLGIMGMGPCASVVDDL